MKKFLSLVITIVMMFSLSGCGKLTSTKYKEVEVTIVGEYYQAEYNELLYEEKTFVRRTVPAIYEIIVKYDGIEYLIDNKDTYDKYKDSIGQTTIGTLEIQTYDDGMVRMGIKELQ